GEGGRVCTPQRTPERRAARVHRLSAALLRAPEIDREGSRRRGGRPAVPAVAVRRTRSRLGGGQHSHSASVNRSKETEGPPEIRHGRRRWADGGPRPVPGPPSSAGRGRQPDGCGKLPLGSVHASGPTPRRIARPRDPCVQVSSGRVRRGGTARSNRAPKSGGGACGSLGAACSSGVSSSL